MEKMEKTIELTGVDLERIRIEGDLRLRSEELALRREEFEHKRRQESKWINASPLMITIISGIIGLTGAGIANFYQSRANLQLEREKSQSSLILKAIETGNPEDAAKNLLFLVRMGLVSDSSGKIAALQRSPGDAPVLPASPSALVPRTASSRELFFQGYRERLGVLTPDGVIALSQLFTFVEQEKSISDVRQVAYILATLRWETANSYRPTTTRGWEHDFAERYGGSRYRGRGYVPLVGEENYRRMNQALGLAGTPQDLLQHPENAVNPQIAFRTLTYGMLNGSFTGRKLGDYVSSEKADYVNARRVVNGLDRAEQIAADAREFETLLRHSIDEH